MQWSLVVSLLLCWPAAAAPTPPGIVPPVGSLGTLQTLHYNTLSPNNNGTAAVLVYDHVSFSDAQSRCAAIGEQLYPLVDAPMANRTEMDHQLDYLVFSGSLQGSDLLWTSSPSSAQSSACQAYSPSRRQTVSSPCDQRLAALCTSRVPATTDRNRDAVESSRLAVASHEYTITGYRDARSFRFLGIPFANPPVNALRFEPPQPYTGWQLIDATRMPASCIQHSSSSDALGRISEDCLYLNVYTPLVPGSDRTNGSNTKPVAVYLYGGSFTQGSASEIDYDGGNLASRNDVVVVTVNYRVGMLGWLTTGDLTTGNYGLRDQLLALQWVQRHIVAFGGDPSRVTVFGQSAGGQSVVALLSSSAAKGLFSGAIVQSAPLDLPWFTRDVYSKLVTPLLADAVGCGDATNPSEAHRVACLRTRPVSAFLDNSTEVQTALAAIANATATSYLQVSELMAATEPLMPIVDADAGIIDDQFYRLLATDRLPNRVPTLFTTVTDEAAVYVGSAVPSLGSSQKALNTLLHVAYPEDLATALVNASVFRTDPSDSDSVRNVAGLALTASEWTCPLSYLLREASSPSKSDSKPIFPRLYALEITSGHARTNKSIPTACLPNSIYNATCHSADVLPIWGTLNSKTKDVDPYYSAKEILHSQLLDDVFGSFFRSRDPNPDMEWLKCRFFDGYGYTFQRAKLV
ncbi:hypothetical protein EYZ11_003468 [Aspergillus tanneri]|uniref:Carboxylic ester hydrolase n=1 Tax=Aspergillus tanneri TaxID=1220188 RepID=A0A4S3JNB8_9EURO|nr:hypothetical protein EYZ11_003468 [Aspergillus tanneri]